MLRTTIYLMAVLLSLAISGQAGASTITGPITWQLAEGGNGHTYEHITPDGGIYWADAKTAAESKTYQGVSGHLVTFSSQEEWDYVVANFPFQKTWIGLSDHIQEGQFEWVTGEPLVFTAWNPGEPNNQNNEDYVHYGSIEGIFGWNDLPNLRTSIYGEPLSYLVEYPIPEPSSLALLFLGITGFAFLGRRRVHR